MLLLLVILMILIWGRKSGVNIISPKRVGAMRRQRSSLLSSVDQRDCNACWAIATCQTVSDRMRARGTIAPNDQLNYNAFHDIIINITPDNDGCGNGAFLETGMDAFVQYGAPLMSETKDRAMDNRYHSSDRKAKMYKVKGWKKVGPNIDSIKRELSNGPVVGVISLYDSFGDFVGSGIYRPRVGEDLDQSMSHMVSIVDYDDTDQTWIIRNSYGPTFGSNGFCKLRWNDPAMDVERYVYAPIL